MSSHCPSSQQLARFLLGNEKRPTLKSLETHLGECPQCRARAEALVVSDELTRLLQDPALEMSSEIESEHLSGAIEMSLQLSKRASTNCRNID